MVIAWVMMTLFVGGLVLPPADAAALEPRVILAADEARDCQAAILKATSAFVGKKLKLVTACAAGAVKCIQTVKPDDEAEDDPIDVCLEKNDLRCEKTAETITKEEDALVERIIDGCAGLSAQDLLSADGVGYELVVDGCADFGVAVTDAASAAQCVMLQHECAVERLVNFENPRAGELIGFDLNGDCLEDYGGSGEGQEDKKIGKTIASCQATIAKTSAAFALHKIKGLGHCLGSLFKCVEVAGGPDLECIAKAQSACDKDFASIDADAVKLQPVFERACGEIDPNLIAEDTAVNTLGLLDSEECIEFGVFGLSSVNTYGQCIYREHDCIGDELLGFAVPRAAELLALVNRTFPGKFFCIPPEDF